MHYNDVSQFRECRELCRRLNLESAMNNEDLLQEILQETLHEIGLKETQSIASDVFIVKQGEVIMHFAESGKLKTNALRKITQLLRERGNDETKRILGNTATCLMEDYGIVLGGFKMP
jgi:hypothetical protein